jgi:hypothetical protein
MTEGPTEALNPADLARLDLDRIKGYKGLLDFYRGIQWEGRQRWGERRLAFNYARAVIDKATSYLMFGMEVAVDPANDGAEAQDAARRAERALYRVHRENGLGQLDFETEIDCAILGDACYKVSWDAATKSVRVTVPDIQGIYAWRQGDHGSRVWRVASKYRLTADETQALHQVKARGRDAAVVEVWTDQEFDLWVDGDLVDRKPNPYGFIPFVIYPNVREPKQFWGTSDLAQIIEPQRELNRAMSQLSRILELSGNPIAVLENVEESEDIAVRPGAVWNIPEDAKAYLLDLLQGGGLRLHIDYINLLYRTLHDVSESPRAAFGGTERDLSGVALEMEMQPLLQKVRRKRAIRTDAYDRRSRMILRLLERYGGDDFGDCQPRVVWGPLLPRDTQKLVANEQTLVQGGIHSRRTAMIQVGVSDPEMEFGRWLEERAAILGMNRELSSRSSRGGGRERDDRPRGDAGEE